MKEIQKKRAAGIIKAAGSAVTTTAESISQLLDGAKPFLDLASQQFKSSQETIQTDFNSSVDESNKNREYAAFLEEMLRNQSLPEDDKRYYQELYAKTYEQQCNIFSDSRKTRRDALKDNKEIVLGAFSILLIAAGYTCGMHSPKK